MPAFLLPLLAGAALKGGGGGSSSTSNSQLSNSIAFNPVISIGGNVEGLRGNASSKPVSTLITDQTDGQASDLAGGYGGTQSSYAANSSGSGDYTMPLIIGGAALAFLIFTGKIKL